MKYCFNAARLNKRQQLCSDNMVSLVFCYPGTPYQAGGDSPPLCEFRI